MNDQFTKTKVFKNVVSKFMDVIMYNNSRNMRLAKCIDTIDVSDMRKRYNFLWWNDAVTLVIIEKILGFTEFSETLFNNLYCISDDKLIEMLEVGVKNYKISNKLNKLSADFD